VIERIQDLVVTRWGARYRGLRFPCAIGRGGIGPKHREGDGITPIGQFRIAAIGYRPDRMDAPASCLPTFAIGPTDIWSDDPDDPAYNHHQSARCHPYSHERLHRPDPLYDMIAVLDFNWPRSTPGAGSAIFLHNWRKPRHPTAGCVAFAPDGLALILATWRPDARVVIRP